MKREIRSFNMTDDEIKAAFEGTNFGPRDHRKLLVGFVLKKICEYHSGCTLNCIALELGFITAKGNITNKGKMFMYNNLTEIK